jgi:hypothetical protein
MSYRSFALRVGEGGIAPSPPAGYVSSSILAEYLTEAELALQLGESPRTTARRRRRREGPPYTVISRRIYYRRDAVHTWLLAQERSPSARRRRR